MTTFPIERITSMTNTEPALQAAPGLADKIRAYLTAHGWTCGAAGRAGAMWTSPAGRQIAVEHDFDPAEHDPRLFGWIAGAISEDESRQDLAVAAEILSPENAAPARVAIEAWTWTRLEGTDVEILADANVRLCVRKAARGDGA